ncbi:hypothetical protein BGZ98_009176 [Dissophora globulifera]|nr:hypothetical protein BGZ98_009176 [Dissophora globulifera]
MPLNHNNHFVVNAAQPARQQIIELKLSEELLEEILNGNESIQVDMNQAMLGISNIEVYKLPAGSNQLDLVGEITEKCAIQRTHARRGQKKATKHEPLRTYVLKKGSKSARPAPGSTPGAPAPASTPVRRPPSPPPSTAAAAGTAVPLKTRVVQLLALQSRGTEERELLKILRVGAENLQSILLTVADLSGGRYILKPETYKEVKIHDWKNYSAKERQAVMKNASAAFDKLGLGPDAPERDILLAEKARRASPPLIAEGYHVVGTMDNSNSKRWSGGAGSESEGFDNGRGSGGASSSLLKPPSNTMATGTSTTTTSTQKKTSAKKSPAISSLSSKKKSTSLTSKSNRRSAEKVAAAILDTVPNHSMRGATTPSGTAKSGLAGTPSLGIGSPTIAGRRPSINGNNSTTTNNNTNTSTNGVAAVKRSTETKKYGNKETGGVGNGYKIPKVGSGSTIPRKPQSPTFAVPPITTQAEYEQVSRQFLAKYQEMKALRMQIDKKKELFDRLGAELELAVGTEREAELKRKVQEAFGEDVVDRKVLRRTGEPRRGVSKEMEAAARAEQDNHLNVRSLAERYKALHHQVETMKRALWDAGTAQANRVGQTVSGLGGGGEGGGGNG